MTAPSQPPPAPRRLRRRPTAAADEQTIRRAAFGGTLLLHLGLLAGSFELRPPESLVPTPAPTPPFEVEAIQIIDVPEETEAPEPAEVPGRDAAVEPTSFVAPDPLVVPPPPGPDLAEALGARGAAPAFADLAPIGADETGPMVRLGNAGPRPSSVLGATDTALIAVLMAAPSETDAVLDRAVGVGLAGGIEGGVEGGQVRGGAIGGGGLGLIGTGIHGSGVIGVGGGGLRQAPQPTTVQVDDAALARYIARIRAALKRAQTYPAAAEDDGLSGTVGLDITIDGQGTILEVVVRRSSGHTVLDQAARDAAESLAHLPAPPPELTWDKRTFRINLRYEPEPL